MGKEENARTNTIFHMFWRLSNINGCVESGWQEWISNKIWKGRNQGAGTMLTQLSEFHFKVKLVFSPRDIFALHSTLFHFQKEPGRGRNIFLSDHWGSILWQTFVKIWVFRPKSDHRLTLSRTHQLTHLLMLLRLHWRDLALASDDCYSVLVDDIFRAMLEYSSGSSLVSGLRLTFCPDIEVEIWSRESSSLGSFALVAMSWQIKDMFTKDSNIGKEKTGLN